MQSFNLKKFTHMVKNLAVFRAAVLTDGHSPRIKIQILKPFLPYFLCMMYNVFIRMANYT